MLASCYRKLADMRKFAKDYDGARMLYLEAISIGERLMADEPGNTEFQEHLSTALHDLAGVLSKIGKPTEARSLLERADKLCSRLIAADPESVESQVRLVFVLADLGRIAKNDSRFDAASESFQRAVDGMVGLMSRGNLEAWSGLDSRYLQNLREELEECQNSPLALGSLGRHSGLPHERGDPAAQDPCPAVGSQAASARVRRNGHRPANLEPKLADDLFAQARGLGHAWPTSTTTQPGPAPQDRHTLPAELRRAVPGCPEPGRGDWLPRRFSD